MKAAASKLLAPLRQTKLRTKMLLSFTFVILIALGTASLIGYSISVQSLQTTTTNYSHYILQQIGKSLEDRATELEEAMFDRFANSGISTVLLAETAGGPHEQVQNEVRIGTFLYSLVYTMAGVERGYLYDAQGKRYFQIKSSMLHEQASELPEPAVDPAVLREYRGQALWVAANEQMMYMERALYDVNTSEYCGYVVLGINSNYLKGEYAPFEALQYGQVYVLNEQGQPLLYQSADEWGAISGKLAGIVDKQQFVAQDTRYLASVHVSPRKGWKLLNVVSRDAITAPAEQIRYWVLIAFLVSFAAAMVLTFVISTHITSNLRLFVSRMKHVSEGFFEKVQPPRSRDEIGLLADKFNLMSDKIQDLIKRNYEEQEQKQMAEFRTLQFEYKALQAQINPHFLYNTLESIQSLAILRGEKKIGRMIYLLGSLLRDTVRNTENEVTLREEVAYIRKYLDIEQLVYDDKLRVSYELDETLLDRLVPKFILQPIVENAIIHGIETKPGIGTIAIGCREEDGTVVLEVKDNGVGMSTDEASRLMRQEEEGIAARVGVRSVHKRVRILYGDRYGLSIASVEGQGTTIRIRLPGAERA
ncbi:MAG: sensor histidine kinase [Paenibacillaceae bacterium]|nr:sensor histidine kinase [Paenibacillaceae bacterium]